MLSVYKVLSAVFALLFVWAAILQYNDPDPLLWYFIYGIAALLSFLFAIQKLPLLLPVVVSFVYLFGAYVFWPDEFEGVTIGAGNINNIEHARESLGLLIMALVMLFYAWRTKVARNGLDV